LFGPPVWPSPRPSEKTIKAVLSQELGRDFSSNLRTGKLYTSPKFLWSEIFGRLEVFQSFLTVFAIRCRANNPSGKDLRESACTIRIIQPCQNIGQRWRVFGDSHG
jgi:hypothetical protein